MPHVGPRITKRSRELPDKEKVDAEDRCGLPIACATGFRTHSRARGGIGAPDLSSQVCTTDEIQHLGVDDTRQTGEVVIPGGRVDSHVLEICVCLETCKSRVA